jgi:hypothetical protein
MTDNNNETTYRVIQQCSGCSQNNRRVNKRNDSCYFNKDRSDLICINRISNHQNTTDIKIIKNILKVRDYPQITEYNTLKSIQVYDYDTALIQNILADKETIIQHIALLHHLRSVFNPDDIIDIHWSKSILSGTYRVPIYWRLIG